MVDCKSVSTPMELNFKKLSGSAAWPILANPTEYRQLIGALMFLVNTRPDICFAVNTLSQQMVEPHHFHWVGAKNLLRYLLGTINHGLRYTAGSVILRGYTDADWAGSVVDRKSTSGCCFNLGSTSISWMSRKQKSVALSTAEAEYIPASMACCEAVWLRNLFSELFQHVLDTTVILCDNQSGIRMTENPVFHDRSKHIDISQFCHVGSHAQQMCHTLSLMDINTGKVGENLITTQLTSSSLILKSTSYLEDEFQPHVGRTKRTDRTAEL
eukprot:PITA_21232